MRECMCVLNGEMKEEQGCVLVELQSFQEARNTMGVLCAVILLVRVERSFGMCS